MLWWDACAYLDSFVSTTGYHFACILWEMAAVNCSLMNLDSYKQSFLWLFPLITEQKQKGIMTNKQFQRTLTFSQVQSSIPQSPHLFNSVTHIRPSHFSFPSVWFQLWYFFQRWDINSSPNSQPGGPGIRICLAFHPKPVLHGWTQPPTIGIQPPKHVKAQHLGRHAYTPLTS